MLDNDTPAEGERMPARGKRDVAAKPKAKKKAKPKKSRRAKRFFEAEDALRKARKTFVKIRSLRVRDKLMHQDMVKLCNLAWKEGLRSAPAGNNRRYCLRDPADGGGFYFVTAASALRDLPKNLAEEQLGLAIHDWQKRATALTHEINDLQSQLPETSEIYDLLGAIL